MIPVNKLDRVAGRIFSNGVRLHKDAILLFQNKSYSSSFQLSVLAQEEIGKAHLIEDVVWQAGPDNVKYITDVDYEKIITDCFLSHQNKQGWFSRMADDVYQYFHPNRKVPKFISDINEGKLEIKKQNATYVGFKRCKRQIDWSSRTIVPDVKEKEVKLHITRVNDYIINLAEGCRRGTHSVDCFSLDKILTIALAEELETLWPFKSKRKAESLKAIRKHDVDEDE